MARANPDYSDEEPARAQAGAALMASYKDAILTGMAESLWTVAYAEWATENPEDAETKLGSAKAGQDWQDSALSNGLPKAAEKAALDLYKLYEAANGDIVQLFGMAETADMDEAFEFSSEGKDKRLDENWKLHDANEFGSGLAMMAMGSGVSWFDDHKEFAYESVRFEATYDGEDLSWAGGMELVREATSTVGRITVVNRDGRDYAKHSYVLAFGAYHDQIFMVYANSLDDAIDECIDYFDENLDDLIIDEQVNAAYAAAIAEGLSEEAAMEQAEQDTTSGGNSSQHISNDWTVVAEDPTDEQLRSIAYPKQNPARRNPELDFDIPGVTNPARRPQGSGRKSLKPNCGGTPNPSRAELSDVGTLKGMIKDQLDSEFAQKVNDVDLKLSPSGKKKTLEQFKDDLASNLAQGLVLDEDMTPNPRRSRQKGR